MQTILSLLRGINVSGQKKIVMSDLRKLYEELKFKNVQTYIQSGNVVFQSSSSKNPSHQIEQKIFDYYKFEVSVMTRTLEELETIISNNPYAKKKNIENDKLYVIFLSEVPEQKYIFLVENKNDSDLFTILGKEIYLYIPNGYGKTSLNNNFFGDNTAFGEIIKDFLNTILSFRKQ